MSENKTKNKEESNLTDVGAFWKKEKNGKNFLSGKVKISGNEYTAFIFKNNKTKPNQPDYRLVLSDLDDSFRPSVSGKNGGGKSSSTPEEVESNNDDIPF